MSYLDDLASIVLASEADGNGATGGAEGKAGNGDGKAAKRTRGLTATEAVHQQLEEPPVRFYQTSEVRYEVSGERFGAGYATGVIGKNAKPASAASTSTRTFACRLS